LKKRVGRIFTYVFDKELLKKYVKRNPNSVALKPIDESDDSELYKLINPSELKYFQQLKLNMDKEFHRAGLSNVIVHMRRFAPVELPSVITLSPETEAEEKLRNIVSGPWWGEEMQDITNEILDRKRKPIFLLLNVDNPLIRTMAEVEWQDKNFGEILMGIYNIAILYSQNLLTKTNANIIHEQVVRLLEKAVNQEIQLTNIMSLLEEERREVFNLRQRQSEVSSKRPDHIRLFMITPFAKEYKTLELAIRRIFERSPYFFEVNLARDYVHKPAILENVREHISQAHGFIAEITDQKPNVMFELGAAMMPKDERPVFTLRRSSASLSVPADFKEKLYIPYGELTDPPQKIEEDIRAAFERDGRTIHEGILGLIEQRKKRFLSRELLENLRHTKLDKNDIENIMKHYLTIEDILSCDQQKLVSQFKIEDYVIASIQGELRNL